jgi:hypothetical protein
MENTSSKNQSQVGAGSAKQKHYEVWVFCLSSLLSIVMFLLFSNVMLMYLASSYNAHVCLDATRAGARAASEGVGDDIIVEVVEHSVRTAAHPGPFITQPEIHSIKFGLLNGTKCLVVNTVTRAKLPAPLLIITDEQIDDGFVIFSKTYVVSLLNLREPKV